ncbi:MAG: hypothetical protein K2X82_02715 [Gemmataceae bacterium]|nr:hypothetical protein [Gemmataceae bacterium]
MQEPCPADPLVETIVREGPIGLGAAARMCGSFRAGRPVHPGTLGRWCQAGARLADGRVVKLDHIRMPGGRLATSRAAVLRFLSALQSADPAPAAGPARTPAAHSRASAAADAKLRALGC